MDRALRARVLLAEAEELGLSVEDLLSASAGRTRRTRPVPTLSAYIAEITPSFTKGTLRTYRSYWRLAESLYGDRPLDTFTYDECERIATAAGERSRHRKRGSSGRPARENCVAALRALFERAKKAQWILENPAKEVDKPRRLPNRRRGLDDEELLEAVDAVRTTSRDVELDLLICDFHLESGARQEVLSTWCWTASTTGAPRCGSGRSSARNASNRSRLPSSAASGSTPSDGGAAKGTHPVFWTRRGRPLTRRHYDTLFGHVQAALPWSVRTPVTAHVLRHTTAEIIERHFGFSMAEAFLGHNPATVTGTYTKARLGEVAAAIAVLTGEAHPLATPLRTHQTDPYRLPLRRHHHVH